MTSTDGSEPDAATTTASGKARRIPLHREQSAMCLTCGTLFEGGWAMANATTHVIETYHTARGTYAAQYVIAPLVQASVDE
jgi:hypothetical protein